MLEKENLLGVGVTNATGNEVLEYILQSLPKNGEKYYIVTPNPEILVYADKHTDFKKILNDARLALCDGTGLLWAGLFLGKNFKERVTGTDLVKNLCFAFSKRPITVGFLGGRPGVAERTAECLVLEYPGLRVAFAEQEWPEEEIPVRLTHAARDARQSYQHNQPQPRSLSESRHPAKTNLKSNSQSTFSSLAGDQAHSKNLNIDILFVAYGFPKQEEWMAKNLEKIPVKVAIGVGGAFDYISGNVGRAPFFVRRAGFEWLFRLIRQPWRLKRQLALLEFIFLILKERLRS